MNKIVLTSILVVLVLIGIGVWVSDTPMPEHVSTTTMTEQQDAGTEMSMESAGKAAAGTYEPYAPEKLALAADEDVVLFFHANWCPTCRAAEKDILENEARIPEDLTILKVNYDTAQELRQRYAVRYQHTFVQVDEHGNLIHMWSGSPTLATIIAEVK